VKYWGCVGGGLRKRNKKNKNTVPTLRRGGGGGGGGGGRGGGRGRGESGRRSVLGVFFFCMVFANHHGRGGENYPKKNRIKLGDHTKKPKPTGGNRNRPTKSTTTNQRGPLVELVVGPQKKRKNIIKKKKTANHPPKGPTRTQSTGWGVDTALLGSRLRQH